MVAITKLLTDGENPIIVIISEKMRQTFNCLGSNTQGCLVTFTPELGVIVINEFRGQTKLKLINCHVSFICPEQNYILSVSMASEMS